MTLKFAVTAVDGGERIQCGWLARRGIGCARVQRVTARVWAMEKLDLAELERAAGGL